MMTNPAPWQLSIAKAAGTVAIAAGVTLATNEAGAGWVLGVAVAIGATLMLTHAVRHLPPRSALARVTSRTTLALTFLAMAGAAVTSGRMKTLAVAAVAFFGLATVLVRTAAQEALYTLLGVAAIGGGVGLVGLGVSGLVGGDTVFGMAMIGLGVALIGVGVSGLVEGNTLFGLAMIGLGAALIGVGASALVEGDTLGGVGLVSAGVAIIVLGVSALVEGDTVSRLAVIGLAMIGLGVALIGVGVSGLVEGNTLFGLAVIGAGAGAIGFGATWIPRARLRGWAQRLLQDPDEDTEQLQ